MAAAQTALPGVTIDDRTEIASGEPEGFAEAATFALNALGRLREGGVMLDGLTLDMAGEARSVDDYQAVVDGAGGNSLPKGLQIVANEITPATVVAVWLERPEGRQYGRSHRLCALARRPRRGGRGGGDAVCRSLGDERHQGRRRRAEDGLDRRDQVRDDATGAARRRGRSSSATRPIRSKARRAIRMPSRRFLRPIPRRCRQASPSTDAECPAAAGLALHVYRRGASATAWSLPDFAPSDEARQGGLVEAGRASFGG